MPLSLKDRVKELTMTTGTGTLLLVSAQSGFRRFNSVLSDGDTTYYCLESGSSWEVGVGTYSANTLARTTVIASSNANALVNITASRSFVFITYAADKAVYKDTSNRTVIGSSGIIFSDSTVQTTAAVSTTTIVGISGTKAQFDTSVTDGNFLYVGDAPTTHAHGNITNAGAIGSTTDLPIVTTTSGVLTAGSFGTTAGTFAAGDDSRITGALSTSTAASTYLPLAGGTLTGDLKFTDATYDIGKSGATRPRDGFFSRYLNAGSDITSQTGTYYGLANYNVYIGNNLVQYRLNTGSIYMSFNHAGYMTLEYRTALAWAPVGQANQTPDLLIIRDAAGILAQRNGTNAQTFRLYNTYTSATSFENLQFKAVAAAAYQIGSAIGSAGGTNRAITFGHWNTAGTFVGTAGITTAATTYGGRFSDDGGLGNGAEQFGQNTTTCIEGLAVGGYATANIQYGTAIGCHAYAGYFSTSLGRNAGTSGTTGGFPSANGFNYCITISDGTDNVAPTASSQFIVAGLWTEAYFGKKVTHATPLDVRFNATGGSGANIAGASFTLAGGKGTGTALGGSLVFQTAPAGSAGSALNSLVTRLTVDSTGLSTFAGPMTLTQPVSTTGSPTALTVTGAAHTTLTLSTESTDVNFNLARTVQFATGALTTQRAVRIQAPTYGFVGASTITTASTLSISGPPVAGTNATITNAYALEIPTGRIGFTGGANTGGIYFAGAGAYYAPHIVSNSDLFIQSPSKINWIFAGSQYMEFYNGIISTSNSIHLGGATYGTGDINIIRDAAGVLATRNGTNAQSFGVYGTWTSTTSYERVNVRGKSSANFEIGPENGSAGGTLRGMTIGCYPAGTSTIVGWAQFRPNASTGALEAFYLGPIADSTAVGGNARGTNAVDLQTGRSSASQVASGSYAVTIGYGNTCSGTNAIAMGWGSTSSGIRSIAIGNQCTASGISTFATGASSTCSSSESGFAAGYSVNVSGSYGAAGFGMETTVSGRSAFATGLQANATRYCQKSHAAGYFAAVGDAQQTLFVLRNKTTDATPVNLGLDGSTTRLTIPSGKTMSGFLIVKGIKSDGSAKARFVRLCDITNVGGTTALDTPIEAIGTDYNPSGCTLAVTAENATDDLQVNITGPAGETWRWTATFSGLEIAYGV